MSFTDGKPWVATAEDARGHWSGAENGERFRCFICGHKFEEGETVRFQYMKQMVNFLVCADCDGADVQERAMEIDGKARMYRQVTGL